MANINITRKLPRRAKVNSGSISMACIGRWMFGRRSVMSLISLAIKKLKNTVKKSRGTLRLQNIISCFFIGILVFNFIHYI